MLYNEVMNLAKEIGKKLQKARKEMRLTQEEVGAKLGIGRPAYANIETGRSLITVEHLLKLPAILQKPVVYFLGIEAGDHSSEPTEKEMLQEIYTALKRSRLISGLNGYDVQAAKEKLGKMGEHPDIEPLLEVWPYLDAVEKRHVYDYIRWRLDQQLKRLNSSERRDPVADRYTIGMIDVMTVIHQIPPDERAAVISYLQNLEDKPSEDD